MRRASLLLSLSLLAAGTCAQSSPPRAQATVRYLALGDSFTIGTGSTPEQSFPARLAARWRARGRRVVLSNLGVNGYSSANLIDRELPDVQAFAPSLVTLAIGANDIVRGVDEPTYRAHVRAVFASLAAHGVPGAHVVAVPQPDWSLSPATADFGDARAINAQIVAYNRVLADEAAAAGARYVDLFPLMHAEALAGAIADDGLHPSAAAYDAWADALEHALPR